MYKITNVHPTDAAHLSMTVWLNRGEVREFRALPQNAHLMEKLGYVRIEEIADKPLAPARPIASVPNPESNVAIAMGTGGKLVMTQLKYKADDYGTVSAAPTPASVALPVPPAEEPKKPENDDPFAEDKPRHKRHES